MHTNYCRLLYCVCLCVVAGDYTCSDFRSLYNEQGCCRHSPASQSAFCQCNLNRTLYYSVGLLDRFHLVNTTKQRERLYHIPIYSSESEAMTGDNQVGIASVEMKEQFGDGVQIYEKSHYTYTLDDGTFTSVSYEKHDHHLETGSIVGDFTKRMIVLSSTGAFTCANYQTTVGVSSSDIRVVKLTTSYF